MCGANRYRLKICHVIQKVCLNDSKVTNISKSFTYKMAAKTGWHRYGTILRHCQRVYFQTNRSQKSTELTHYRCIPPIVHGAFSVASWAFAASSVF